MPSLPAPTAYAIVAASSASHAYWNYLLKRSGGGQSFITISKVIEVVLMAPFLLLISAPERATVIRHWPITVVGAVFVLANYIALSRAYASGNLSVVYPVSRGAILVALPLLGFLALGERISLVGAAALLLVVLGIAVLPLQEFTLAAVRSAFGVANEGVVFSLLAATFAALYTVWSKYALGILPSFAYFFSYTALTALGLLLMFRSRGLVSFRDLWRQHWWAIVRVAALNSGTYLLVLLALRDANSSYVIAIRQLSIVWSVGFGYFALHEPITVAQQTGMAILLTGCVLVALT